MICKCTEVRIDKVVTEECVQQIFLYFTSNEKFFFEKNETKGNEIFYVFHCDTLISFSAHQYLNKSSEFVKRKNYSRTLF